MSNNILQPIPQTLNNYLLQNGETVLSDTTPAAPQGSTNVTWQSDQFGNISAYSSGGGASLPANLNVVATNGAGAAVEATNIGVLDSVSGSTVALIPSLTSVPANTVGVSQVNGALVAFSPNADSSGAGQVNFLVANPNGDTSGLTGLFSVFNNAEVVTYNNLLDDGFGFMIVAGAVVAGGGRGADRSSALAYLTAQASDGTSGTAALGIHPGTLAATPVAGTLEYDGTSLYFTPSSGTRAVLGASAPGTATPLINGTAAVGTSLLYSRQDHVHPTDTTRAATASPTFTGVPLAPTPAVSTNTTQLATTAFVLGQVATVAPLPNGTAAVGASLLYARQDHVHASDTTKANNASPALTGTPTSTTAAVNTSTTQIATTAYVIAQEGGAQSGATHVVAGTGAGTTPTLTATGVDSAHQLSITTGTTPTASGPILTLTFVNARPHTAYPTLTPANAAAAALTSTSALFVSASSTTAYTLTAGSVALLPATTYLFNVAAH